MNRDKPTARTYATLANMRAMQAKGATYCGPNRLVAWNQATGDEFSANPDDYFWLPDDVCLKDSRGRKLVLAFVQSTKHVLA
jgi:hypothetical protein